MRIVIFNVITILLLITNAYVQPDSLWSRTFGYSERDEFYKLIQTSDGGFALAGFSESPEDGRESFYLVRTDENGNEIWSQTYRYEEYDRSNCWSIIQTGDNGFLLAGKTVDRLSYSKIYLVRTDSTGQELWSRVYDLGDWSNCYSICETFDGDYLLAGGTEYFEDIQQISDAIVMKVDAEGDSIWTASWGGPDFDWFMSVECTSDSGYILSGVTYTGDDPVMSGFVVKLDQHFEEEWNYINEVEGLYNSFEWTTEMNNGGFVSVGLTAVPDENQTDFYIIGLSENGELLWSHSFGGVLNERSFSVMKTLDSNLAVVGRSLSAGAMIGDGYLIKYDENGEQIWCTTFGGENLDICYDIIQTENGSYVIAGSTESFGEGDKDGWLVKTETDLKVYDNPINQPGSFSISRIHPNPFNSTTTISYSLPVASQVSLKIFDLSGREVRSLVEGYVEAGNHSISLSGEGMASGVYLVKMEAGAREQVRKVLLVR